jgi:hypothetical protein
VPRDWSVSHRSQWEVEKMKTQLAIEVREYFVELHKKEGGSRYLLESDLFAAEKQSIDQQYVATTDTKQKATFDTLAAQLSPKKKNIQSRKKSLTVKQGMLQFPDSGFCIGSTRGHIHCKCGNKALGSNFKWGDNVYNCHIAGKKNKKFVR